ncbi:MAG: tetratricopeptide repeat protein [Balneolaceae bacterium]|nr:MAG: tetratricopeptide repeat protein [Balneolaceae bacterium]
MIRNSTIQFFILLFFLIPVFPLSAQQVQQESGYHHFQEGLNLFERGLFKEAVSLFEEAERAAQNQLQRETASFYLTRAKLHIDFRGADRYVDTFVQTYPESNRSVILLRDLAELYLEQQDYNRAIRRMEQALNYPQSYMARAELYYNLAETAADAGNYPLARHYFFELSNDHGRSIWSPQALYSRGRLYLEDERYEDAADAFELLMKRHPNTAMARRVGTALGESYYQQQRYQEAADALQEALGYLDSENRLRALYLIAESYNMLNNYRDATRFYREYLRSVESPEQERIAHFGLGWVFHKQEIYQWAAASFASAADGEDDLARRALYYQAVNEKLGGRVRNSIQLFREFGDRFGEGVFHEVARYEWAVTALESGLNNEAVEVLLPLAQNLANLERPGQVLTLLGEAYYANGEYSNAITAFELAAEQEEIDDALKRQARFQRAWVRYFNQAYQQAQPDFEAVYLEAPDTPLGSEALFWSADAHFQAGNFGPAARQFREFVNRYPQSEFIAPAKYSLGWSYFLMGDFENATAPLIDFLNNYEPPDIALFPYDTDTRLRIGDSFFAQGKYREALEYYMATIGADPGGDYAMFQVANSHYRMNRNFEAVTQFRRLLRIYPFSRLREQAQYNIAYIYLVTGNYDQAIEEFQTVIRRFPGTEWAARAQYNIGDSHYNSGNFEAAIEAYQRVLDEYPRSRYIIEAIDGIQFAQLSAGGSDTSTDILEDFLADNPTSQTADRLRFRQAENVLQTGDYNAAIREFRQYLRITNNRSQMPEAYYNMADAYLRLGNRAEAASNFETLINDFPDSERVAPAIAELARIQFELGNYSESLRRYQQLGELDSRNRTEAAIGIGNAELELGNRDAARQQFEQVLAENPENNAARIGLGKVLFRDGRTEEAQRFFRLVAESDFAESGAEAQYMLGEMEFAAGNRDAAIEAFSRVGTLFEAYSEWVANAQMRIAEIYIREGRRGEAVAVLNSIIDRYPDTEAATRAQRLLRSN